MICTNHLSIQTYQQTSTEHNSFSAIFTESEVTSGPAACRKVAKSHEKTHRHNVPQRGRILHVHTF